MTRPNVHISFTRTRWLPLLAIVVVVILHSQALLPFQDFLRTHSFDVYQKLAPRERQSAPVLIVSIDEQSLIRWGQWPWPRTLLAKLLDRVWAQQPAAVGLDLLMPEIDRTSPCDILRHVAQADDKLRRAVCKLSRNDELLAKSLSKGPAVLGVAGMDHSTTKVRRAPPFRILGPDPSKHLRHFDGALVNIEVLEAAASGHAILSADLEYGAVRRVPLIANVAGTSIPSLPLELLRLATEGTSLQVRTNPDGVISVGVKDLSIPTDASGALWIRFGHHDTDRFVSAADLLEGKLPAATLQDKLVLIGFTGLGLTDFHMTSLGDRIPGVEIHAQALENIFDGTSLRRPEWALKLEGFLMLAIGLYVLWGFPRMRARILIPSMATATVLLAVAGFLVFLHAGLLIDVVSPISIFLAASLFVLAEMHVRDEFDRRRLEADLRVERDETARARGEMEAARRIQMGTLPNIRETFREESRLDIAALMEPARLVGGDFYDCFMLDQDHVFLCLGDVCGKGVPASLFMVISKTICKSLALRAHGNILQPSVLLMDANRELSRDNAEMLFVTVFVAILDLRNGELRYSNAGHDRPFLASHAVEAIALEGASGPPLCVVDDFPYETHVTKLSPNVLLFIFSDGVTEAFNPAQEQFGLSRVKHFLSRTESTLSANHVLDGMRNSVLDFTRGAEASDDFTAVALRWSPPCDARES